MFHVFFFSCHDNKPFGSLWSKSKLFHLRRGCLRTGDHMEAMIWLAALPLSGMLGGLLAQSSWPGKLYNIQHHSIMMEYSQM